MTEDNIEWPIPEDMEARINHWHKRLMPHLLSRDEDATPVCVPDYWMYPAANYSPELTELLEAITTDIEPWLAGLPTEAGWGPANIYFGPDHATLMIGGIDYYLPLELEAA